MPLRLDTKISDYIANTLKYKAKLVKNNFGQGVKGQEFFTTTFNNAVMNFIYQNYMSNYVDADGQLTNLPAEYEGKSVVINNESNEDVIITDNQIIVNTKLIEQDYNAKKFLITSTAQDSYLNRGLDVFTPKQNPFPTINSYYRYVIERQYLFNTVTDEELESNAIFKRNLQRYKDGLAAIQAFVSEMALKNTFNQAYIMGSTKYSYTESLLGILSELKESPKLVADYPIINQLSKARIRGNFSIIEFADKNNAEGAIADGYRRNLLQLADRTIQKVKDPADNARISEMFEVFPLMMFYQHGVGKSRLGFPKILDVTSYMDNMTRASLNFQRNYLSENTLDIILDRIIKDKRMPVKTYGIPLEAYNEPVAVNEEEIEEAFDWDEGSESISESKFEKKNLFTVTPQQGVSDKKAKIKASIATKFIGFGEGIVGSNGKTSSTELYRQQAGQYANTGDYSTDDIIFVSIPGNRGKAEISKREQDRTIKEALRAIENGATLITDNQKYIESSAYNTGEKRLFKNLEAKGYSYSEETVDGELLGVWNKTDQPNQDVLSLEEQLNLLNNELAELEAQQEEAFENDPYLLIAMNLPKIKPESARKETGVKVGTGRDINPSLLSKDGYTVSGAAHYIKEFAFYEESGRQLLDEQEIRNEIVQILQIGKENYMRDYNMQYEIDQKKAEIQDVQNRINTEQGLVNLTSIQEDFGAKFKQAFIDNGNKMPDTFEAVPGKSIWALNRDTNLYSLVDNDGTILMEDVSMILGRIVNTKKSNKPVSNRRKQQDLLSLNSIASDLDMNSLMAIKGYDVNDFISKLEAAQTESEYNQIMSKIRELLC
jgi:hypothetical protein